MKHEDIKQIGSESKRPANAKRLYVKPQADVVKLTGENRLYNGVILGCNAVGKCS